MRILIPRTDFEDVVYVWNGVPGLRTVSARYAYTKKKDVDLYFASSYWSRRKLADVPKT